jgi:hypothetical protein
MTRSPCARTVGRLATALLVTAWLAVGVGLRAAAADQPSPEAPAKDILLTARRGGGICATYVDLVVYTDGTAALTSRSVVCRTPEQRREFTLDEVLLTEDQRRAIGEDVERLTLDLLMQRLHAVQFPSRYCRGPCPAPFVALSIEYWGAGMPEGEPVQDAEEALRPVLGIIEILLGQLGGT